jgi:hypothetical protein
VLSALSRLLDESENWILRLFLLDQTRTVWLVVVLFLARASDKMCIAVIVVWCEKIENEKESAKRVSSSKMDYEINLDDNIRSEHVL